MSHVLRRVDMCWEREDIFVGPCVLLGAGRPLAVAAGQGRVLLHYAWNFGALSGL